MSTKPVLLHDLALLVENAVQQIIEKHGGGPVEKIWVGFVAPEALATQDVASKIAHEISQKGGLPGTASIATPLAAPVTGAQAHAVGKPGHIIGLVYQAPLVK